MSDKKWSTFAQLLIAIGVISSLRYIILSFLSGVFLQDIFGIVYSIVGLVIYWGIYKLKKWAMTGLNILLPLNILLNLISLFNKTKPTLNCSIGIVFSVLMLIYFNLDKRIKELFS